MYDERKSGDTPLDRAPDDGEIKKFGHIVNAEMEAFDDIHHSRLLHSVLFEYCRRKNGKIEEIEAKIVRLHEEINSMEALRAKNLESISELKDIANLAVNQMEKFNE